jgi:hypothetical protein
MVVAKIDITSKALTSNVYYDLPDYYPPIDYIYTGTSVAANQNKGAFYRFGTTYLAHLTCLDVRAYYRGTKKFQLRRSIAAHGGNAILTLNYRSPNEGNNIVPT